MKKRHLSSFLIFFLTLISCSTAPIIYMSKNHRFDASKTLFIMPFVDVPNNIFINTENIFIKLLKKKKTYSLCTVKVFLGKEKDREPELLKYSAMYRDKKLMPENVMQLRDLIKSTDGYVIFSSIDEVSTKPVKETVEHEDRNRKDHFIDLLPTPSTTYYKTRLVIAGRLSIYDLSDGQEVFRANHTRKKDKLESMSSEDCSLPGCLFNVATEPRANKELAKITLEMFAKKVLEEYYKGIIKKIPR